MTLKILILLSFFSANFVEAVQFAKKPVAKSTRSVATDPNAEAVRTLQMISSCVKTEKTPELMRSCGSNQLSKTLSAVDRDRLMMWFQLPFEVSYPIACAVNETELLPEEILKKSKLILCSKYKEITLEKTAVFFFTIEDGKTRLLNLKH